MGAEDVRRQNLNVFRMTIGAGKYDDVCTMVREETQALGVALIVLGGNKGQGFSVQVVDVRIMATLPEILESMARQIRKDVHG